MRYADVILPLPIEGMFTYTVPNNLESQVRFGVRVTVPLGRKKTYVGIVAHVHDTKPEGFDVKDIYSVLDREPVIFDEQYHLWQWIARYYIAPIGDVYNAAMPAGMKDDDSYRPRTEKYVTLGELYRSEKSLHLALDILQKSFRQKDVFETFLTLTHWDSLDGETPETEPTDITREELMNETHADSNVIRNLEKRGFMKTYEKEVGRLGMNDLAAPSEDAKPLNEKQQQAMTEIEQQWTEKNVVLLHGVTSSGKTEIYIHLIQKALKEGKQVLYLLPEIALTVQITERLRRVFGSQLGIYHSRYTDAERVEIWKRQISDNPYNVILGARSAIFMPFRQLGLVIIDEEHDQSFKQQDPSPRYHARSTAIMMARMFGAKVLLGTATPSVETYNNAISGKYGLVELKERYKGIQLPHIEIVDIKDLRHRKMMNGPFSPQLLAAIRETLERKEQVILFQNRRGFAPMIMCSNCGWTPKCTNCDVSLTFHKNTHQLTCHYCGYTYQVPEKCPSCGGTELTDRGYGTERIEDRILELFPKVRVARMDLDTTRTKGAYERIIGDFSAGKTDILIGTQMVTKGLDFDRVSLVGILDADTMLNHPDFRAYEYAFMMMAQVSGRAGRKGSQGRVMLQTRHADMPLIGQVVKNDYLGFYNDVLPEREMFHYPPYTRLIYIYLKHRDNKTVEDAAQRLAYALRKSFGDRVLGPDKPSVARIKTLFIRKIMMKMEISSSIDGVRHILRQAQSDILSGKRFATVQIYYDVDPT
jgi:primosomal protein N' (replication factor Y)